MTGTNISLERTNELINLFSEAQKHAMRGEQRSAMRSVLFDLGRRSPLGWRCLYEHQVPFLKEIAAIMEPDEIGRRMRGLGNRPTNLQPFILMCSEFGWRQQMMLDAGLSEGDPFAEDVPADLAYVCDFWARCMGAYRQDGFLLPEQHGGVLRILDAPDLELLDRVTDGGGTNELPKVRRMAATLELYSFVVHGEQRDGISGHGPYPQPDGSTIFVREFSDLRNDYLPWAKTETENPWDAVVIAYRARGVEVKNDVLSTMFVTPHEYADLVEGVSVMAKRDGDTELTPLSAEQVADVTRRCRLRPGGALPGRAAVGRPLQDRLRRSAVRKPRVAVRQAGRRRP